MPKIVKLPPHEARKIAAGEVVERPANVVKELIENSIDAGATTIALYVKDGGRELIRVVDNGCGISADEVPYAFEHHATSKISSVDDLATIDTFGFRGEALSSIASVSSVTIVTKQTEDTEGCRVILDYGTVTTQEASAAPDGTDITIEHIFDNIPARKKFLKKRETEWRHIQRLFQSICLAYTAIHFRLYSEGSLVLNCPPTDGLAARIGQVWDQQAGARMIQLEEHDEKNAIHISGVTSDHQYARYDRNNILFFVNNRLVKNQPLSRALLKGYLSVLPPGRYPAACINITVDPDVVDVNVHPRKEEVQFLNPRRIETLIKKAVTSAIETNLSQQIRQDVSLAPAQPAAYNLPPAQPFSEQLFVDAPPFEEFVTPPTAQPYYKPEESGLSFAPNAFNYKPAPQIIRKAQSTEPDQLPQQATIDEKTLSETAQEKNYRLIGQFYKTYILLEKKEGLYLVDQHAAHERVLYEIFSKRFEDVATVTLMFPQLITLTADTITLLESHFSLFKRNGIALERFGHDQVRITATPVHIKNINYEDLIQTVLGWIEELQDLDEKDFFKKINERMHAQMACKAAVKAGDILTNEQMIKLLDDLEKTENRFTCPHSRPTGWLLSTYEIEKRFKRVV